jgi:hypothetical protein
MKQIPLSQQGKHKGKFIALVDDGDFEWLNQWRWSFIGNGYAYRKVNQKNIRMHKVIMECPKNLFIDHINGNRLDNRRENLRIATFQQNSQNVTKRANTTSIYKGVTWEKFTNAWACRLRNKTIGRFKEERHAALAYDIWASEFYGEFAKLNFN